MLTQEYLKSILHYDKETGHFTWTKKTCHKVVVGKRAGALCDGYIFIRISRKLYRAHRLAFLYVEGLIPELCDHINRDAKDNRWCNLRPATKAQNSINSKIHKTNTSGYRGVSWEKVKNKWKATVIHNGRPIHAGFFDCPSKASVAYKAKAVEIFGEFVV